MMVATVLEGTPSGVAAAIGELEARADAFEIRFDALKRPAEPGAIRRLTRKRLIATCRRPSEGGAYRGAEHDRLALLESAAQAGFDWVDVEGPTQLPVAEERLIRSFHDLRSTCSAKDLARLGRSLAARGARAKIATRVRNFEDVVELLVSLRQLRNQGVAASVMGLGAFPRPLAHLLGSDLVYGGARAPAPGQPRLDELLHELDHWGRPGPASELYLVVGSPIAHSLSPRLHNAAFRAVGRDASYGALEVRTAEELRHLLERAVGLGLLGLSVTAPLKEAAFDAVDQRTPEAASAGSVNCVRFDGGLSIGHTTDGAGAARVIEGLLGRRPKPPRALLIGSGGAARAILACAPAVTFVVAGRDARRLAQLNERFRVETISLKRARAEGFDLLVNATSVPEPLPIGSHRGALFDLQYGEAATAWERHARAHQLSFAGGRELLLEQAVDAFAFWTGRPAPRDAMAAAVGGPA